MISLLLTLGILVGAPEADQDRIDFLEGRKFWAFQPPRQSEVPAVANMRWPWTEIDRFILSRLEANGLHPGGDCDRRTLIRRAYFDLVGLPPEPDAVHAFIGDPAPNAFVKIVDRLLGSPRFGERWGRHWLDVARFAESSGGGRSLMFRNAWRYRDYVIAAFNKDKPYDRFVTEQIAGDLLPYETPEQRDEQLTATGYLVLGPTNYELQDKELLRMEVVDEQIDTVGRTFLGLTPGCARCHDHKFDPIPTTDYYALAGIFRSTKTLTPGNVSGYVEQKLTVSAEHQEALARHAEVVKQLEARIKEAEESLKQLRAKAKIGRDPSRPPTLAPELTIAQLRLKKLRAELKAVKKAAPPPPPLAMSVTDEKGPRDWHVLVRGDVRNLGPEVGRGFLSVVTNDALAAKPEIPPGHSGRLELGRWLTSPSNPLVARVVVNRIWQHLIGAGLVRTPDNFGTMGERPSHPDLLDYLAIRFMEDGWSTKRMIRRIVLSRVYRLSSRGYSSRDPENRLLSFAHRKPLDAECLRDAMLAISGQLDLTTGGLTIRKLTQYDLGYKFDTRRRSVYVPLFRNSLFEPFEIFDFANPNSVTGKRNVSTLPTQALYLMNSPFVADQARRAAELLLAVADLAPTEHIDLAYRRALGRPPAEAERLMALEYIDSFRNEEVGERTSADLEAWTSLYHALFASVDFRYLK